jgi:hypothetical protein
LTFWKSALTLNIIHLTTMKSYLKERAVELRKNGLTYREIMEQIPIAKSTLSDWLRSVGLSKEQKQILTAKRLAARQLGAQAKHAQRIAQTEEIMEVAKEDVGVISQRELWLIGVMLYWAEGSKEKEYRPGSRASFTNSDPDMIRIFLRWLIEVCNKDLSDITFDIYIHELHRHRTEEIINFWAKTIHCDASDFQHIYYKKGNPKTLRKNVGISYHGIIKINVKSSSKLTRTIAGWTRGVVESIR